MISELDIKKSTTLNAFIKVNGTNILHLTATVNENGNVSYNKIIHDKALYRENIAEIDTKVAEFESELKLVEQDIRGDLNETI